MIRHPRRIILRPLLVTSSTRYNSHTGKPHGDLQAELFPLHSPLLGESLLVSFPPLSYMLKSSGSSCLISGPVCKGLGGGLLKAPTPRYSARTMATRCLTNKNTAPSITHFTCLGACCIQLGFDTKLKLPHHAGNEEKRQLSTFIQGRMFPYFKHHSWRCNWECSSVHRRPLSENNSG